jgi:chorismate mutase
MTTAEAQVEAKRELAELRARLDEIDSAIVDLLGERFTVTRRVAEVKRDGDLNPVDPDRERVMMGVLRKRAETNGIDPDLVQALYREIINSVVAGHRLVRQ